MSIPTPPPLPEDEYLTREETTRLWEVLHEQMQDILGRTQENVASLTQEEESAPDELDIAVSASSRELLLRAADRERQLLGKVRAAIQRLLEGNAGTCENCGGPIGFGRLLARPVATQCIDCKTEAELLTPKHRTAM